MLHDPFVIVDDDADDLQMMVSAIHSFIWESQPVLPLSSGRELLSLLTSDQLVPALLVIDMHLPNLSGVELLYLIKEIDWLKQVPKVLISGDRHNLQAAYQAGADAFYTKPASVHEYYQIVQDIKQTLLK